MNSNRLKYSFAVAFCLSFILSLNVQCMDIDEETNGFPALQQQEEGQRHLANHYNSPLHPKKREREDDGKKDNITPKKPRTLLLSEESPLPEYFSSGLQTREEKPDHNKTETSVTRQKYPVTRRESCQWSHPNSFAHRRIPNQLMFATVFIRTDISSGTGFVFNFEPEGFPENTYFPCLVTNKHVIADKEKKANVGTLVFHKKADDKNEPCLKKECITTKCPANFHQYWIYHPKADLCILPLNFFKDTQPFYMGIDKEEIPSEEQIKDLSAVEEILMLGYPNGLWDSVNNFPIFRKGISATHPAFDFNGKPEFLMDIGSFPGSSGGPVFIYNWGSFEAGDCKVNGIPRHFFMGVSRAANTIVLSKLEKDKPGEEFVLAPADRVSSKDGANVVNIRMPTHLGYVIKATTLLEVEKTLSDMISGKTQVPPILDWKLPS